jgi:hypothetical protein
MRVWIIIFFILSCNRNDFESKLKQAIREKDYLTVANICSEYKSKDFEQDCEMGIKDSIFEIEKIISQRKELPFIKLIIDKEKARKIQQLLKNNIHLGIKYRSIWNETTEQRSE